MTRDPSLDHLPPADRFVLMSSVIPPEAIERADRHLLEIADGLPTGDTDRKTQDRLEALRCRLLGEAIIDIYHRGGWKDKELQRIGLACLKKAADLRAQTYIINNARPRSAKPRRAA